MWMLPRLFPALLLLGLVAAVGVATDTASASDAPVASAPGVGVQRARIKADRDRIEAQFAAEQNACRERFAVTACTDDVRLRRRAALAVPRAQALALDDMERKQRATARREAVAGKQSRAAERPVPAPAEIAPPQAASAPASTSASAPAAHAPKPRAASAPHAAASSAAAAAARRAQASKARQTQIQQGQTRIEARQAEHARGHKPSTPLTTPSAASMPGR